MKITFPMALLLLFVGLKLGKIIDWSWMWVLSPLWIPLPIALFFIVALVIVRKFETPEERVVRHMREYAAALSKHKS